MSVYRSAAERETDEVPARRWGRALVCLVRGHRWVVLSTTCGAEGLLRELPGESFASFRLHQDRQCVSCGKRELEGTRSADRYGCHVCGAPKGSPCRPKGVVRMPDGSRRVRGLFRVPRGPSLGVDPRYVDHSKGRG